VGYNAEFYSGADLSALLAEAQLAAVHEALEASSSGEWAVEAAATSAGRPQQPRQPQQQPRATISPAVIQGRHLEAALLAARPSVPEAERERLEAVYSAFRQDRQPAGLGAAAADKGKGKLVSWA
jgi:SpoVK/Ycf46/Vps4 family AAA+-type ATPase